MNQTSTNSTPVGAASPSGGRLSKGKSSSMRATATPCFTSRFFPDRNFEALRSIFEENLARFGDEDLDTMHFRDARLLEFLLDDAVPDLVEPLVGPDIGLWSSHFIRHENTA